MSRRGRHARRLPVSAGAAVHRPERGRGEGDEHGGVLGDGFGDAVTAAQPGDEDLVGVALIQPGAGGADGLAAVPARHRDVSAGLAGAVDGGDDLPGGGIMLALPSGQPDRLAALAGGVVDVAQDRQAAGGMAGRAVRTTHRWLPHRSGGERASMPGVSVPACLQGLVPVLASYGTGVCAMSGCGLRGLVRALREFRDACGPLAMVPGEW